MKSLIFAMVAMTATALLPTTAAAQYAAMAAGKRGTVYEPNAPTMDEARRRAVVTCRRNQYGSCNVSVAEGSDWYYAAAYCGGEPYVAATTRSAERARELVRRKAYADNNYNCSHWRLFGGPQGIQRAVGSPWFPSNM